MDDLKEKVLELASQDEEFAEKLKAAGTEEAVAELLQEKGLDVAAEDLKALAQAAPEGAVKLSEDELDVVAGGGTCVCATYGGGAKGGNDKACVCDILGYGMSSDDKDHTRCSCLYVGEGDSHN